MHRAGDDTQIGAPQGEPERQRGRRILIAPDSFKGTLTAAEAARAIAEGWRQARPADDLVRMPMADGGEGTLDAFAVAIPAARRIPVRVDGPDDRPVDTFVLMLPDETAVVELAATSGLPLLDRLRPGTAHTRGFGQAIRAALDAGATRLFLAVGGSASLDGGLGLLRELGATVAGDGDDLSAAGRGTESGNLALGSVTRVDLTTAVPVPERGAVILSDVTSPLLGPGGAAAVFGRQKGMERDAEPHYERRLGHWAELVAPPLARRPGAGAAGGAAFGLLAWGAELRSGAEAVADALGLRERLRHSDAVITGEGSFDAQSGMGKVASVVTGIEPELPAMLVAGVITAPTDRFLDAVSLTELAQAATGSTDAALADPSGFARLAGARLAARFIPVS